ncbi:MAG: hypothetical protein V2A63_02945 [Patescibacteria group bacterium]
MDYPEILIGLLSGGAIVAVVQHFLDKKKEAEIQLNRIKEEKYRSLLIFMTCSMDFEKRKYFSLSEQVEMSNSEDYLNKIKEYFYHNVLFASDEVILAIKGFIHSPDQENFVKTAKAMRRDLWGTKTKLTMQDLLVDSK